jgi:hypothetical protein
MRPGIDRDQLVQYVIRPTLTEAGQLIGKKCNSRAARQLLLVTACVESHCGHYLRQIRGPAVGIYQMEPATYRWLTSTQVGPHLPPLARITSCLHCATLACRLRYWLVPHPLPAADDRDGLWHYYKKFWNSTAGATTKTQFGWAWDQWQIDQVR